MLHLRIYGPQSSLRPDRKSLGAAAVLGVNVLMLLIAGSATLLVQRRLARRNAEFTPSGRGL